jgi:hypothetical protein
MPLTLQPVSKEQKLIKKLNYQKDVPSKNEPQLVPLEKTTKTGKDLKTTITNQKPT